MRSRFTAHVLKDYEHLHRSHLESSKEPFDPGEKPEGRDWTRLEIRAHTPGPRPGAATVDFTAYFKEGDAEQAFHELAEFRQVEGAWYYVRPLREGPAPIRSTQAKVGRNDPCPCGSGKKFKACCLNR
jgi:SEC-C motif-containing protein